jgi:AraC-like DNA-binding protein
MERWISALWTERLIEVARGRGLDVAPLWAKSGLSPGSSPEARVSDAVHVALWDEVMRQSDAGFPIEFARSMRLDDYAALGLACKTAETLGVALKRTARYLALYTNAVKFELRVERRNAVVVLHRGGRGSVGYRASMESSIAELAASIRAMAGAPVQIHAVTFAHPAPADLSAHREHFRCELLFDAENYGVVLPAAALSTPLRLADAGLSQFMLAHLDAKAAASVEPRSVLDDVIDAISHELPSGPPQVKRVASRLGLSPRTLQRRLREAGHTFQGLVTHTRQVLARAMLLESAHSLPEIGFLLGYSEPSAFHRAFRRWFDLTPAEFRKRGEVESR